MTDTEATSISRAWHGMTTYGYCAGDPILLADPNGASPKDKIIAVGIGVLTNIVPNSGFLRDKYSPDDKAEYNENLQKVDNACLVAGFALAGKGVADLSVGSAVAATGFAVATTGVGTVAGAGMIVEGGAVDAKGLAEVAVGATMAMNAAENAGKGYDRGGDKRSRSLGQLQQDVEKGTCPRGIKRFDKGRGFKEQDHVHFNDKSALNKDGTWKHGKRDLTKEEIKYLKENGWNIE